jgi:hypothetical protein
MEESMQPQLKSLGERLLRAGVAHRHVRRYIRELREHYEDAVREELAKGLDRSQAERAAWSRLGSEEELARSVLAQPDVRVLPVMLGVVLLMVSGRQRIRPLWPIIGAAIVAVLGGTTNVHLTLAAIPDASSVGIDNALLPIFFRHSKVLGRPDVLALAGGLVRAALMLAVAAVLSVIWRNRQDRSSNASIC